MRSNTAGMHSASWSHWARKISLNRASSSPACTSSNALALSRASSGRSSASRRTCGEKEPSSPDRTRTWLGSLSLTSMNRIARSLLNQV